MHLKVLARHLHPMTNPGHRTGVTTGSSTQPGGSVQLLAPRNGMNHYGQKQRRSHRCHTRMHRMQNSYRCWKTQPWSLSLYNNKKPKKQSWKTRIDEILHSTQQDDSSSRNKIGDKKLPGDYLRKSSLFQKPLLLNISFFNTWGGACLEKTPFSKKCQ